MIKYFWLQVPRKCPFGLLIKTGYRKVKKLVSGLLYGCAPATALFYIHYFRVQKNPPLIPFLSRMNPVCALTVCILK
jgi:hypothetical protein